MQQLSASEDAGVVLVAQRNTGALCGFAEVSIRRDHVDGASAVPVAYLEGWYVEPDVRGTGVGWQLLEAVEKWAAGRGLKELASDAELGQHRSSSFLWVHRNLPGCAFYQTDPGSSPWANRR
jgi:aminoglycoside 6'-N-acetyltransferase I